MNIKILGGESLGNRSLCCKIECSSLIIMLDPGVALGPRFNLLPHPLEYASLKKTRIQIEKEAMDCDAIFISHYHYDHYTPFWDEIDNIWTFASKESALKIYNGKKLFIKDPFENINQSQRNRAKHFLENLKKVAREISIADSKEFKIGSTKIYFSEPMPHGEEGTPLGYVSMALIEDKGEKFLFASDIEGPISNKVLEKIISLKPNSMLVSGPPLYLLGSKLSKDNFESAISNLKKLLSFVDVLILDHHLLRSEESIDYFRKLKEVADEKGSILLSIAEFQGLQNDLLEAKRKRLYQEIPPSNEFMKWTSKRIGLPPI